MVLINFTCIDADIEFAESYLRVTGIRETHLLLATFKIPEKYQCFLSFKINSSRKLESLFSKITRFTAL